jgi:hypothetical protein
MVRCTGLSTDGPLKAKYIEKKGGEPADSQKTWCPSRRREDRDKTLNCIPWAIRRWSSIS